MAAHFITIPHIDYAMAHEAEEIFAQSCLSLSDAVRRLVSRTVKQKHVPLDLLSPNAETLEAMAEFDRGEAKSFHSLDDLMADLNADD